MSSDRKTVFSSQTTQRQCCSSSLDRRSDFMSPVNHTSYKKQRENAATNLTKVVWVEARLVASAAMMTRSAPASQLIWRSTCTTRHEHSFWPRASRIRYGHIQTKLTFICGFSLNPPPPTHQPTPNTHELVQQVRTLMHTIKNLYKCFCMHTRTYTSKRANATSRLHAPEHNELTFTAVVLVHNKFFSPWPPLHPQTSCRIRVTGNAQRHTVRATEEEEKQISAFGLPWYSFLVALFRYSLQVEDLREVGRSLISHFEPFLLTLRTVP